MRRTPPMLGWAGMDLGLRRAFSFAKIKRRIDEDDGNEPQVEPICLCDFGDTVSVTIAGVTPCIGTTYYATLADRYTFTGATDPNGVHSVPWVTSEENCNLGGGELVIGTVTVTRELLVDGDWELEETIEAFLAIIVGCELGELSVTVAPTEAPPLNPILFQSDGGAIGVAMDNLGESCVGDVPGGGPFFGGIDGTAVVEP